MILFAEKYGLTINEIMAEMEKVLSAILSLWYRLELMVSFRHNLKPEAVAYEKIGGIVLQRVIDLEKMRLSILWKRRNMLSFHRVMIINVANWSQEGVFNISYKNYRKYLLQKYLCQKGEIEIGRCRLSFMELSRKQQTYYLPPFVWQEFQGMDVVVIKAVGNDRCFL